MDFGPVYAAHLSYACLLAILLDLCTLVSEAIYESLSSLGQLLGDLNCHVKAYASLEGQCGMLSNVCESLN